MWAPAEEKLWLLNPNGSKDVFRRVSRWMFYLQINVCDVTLQLLISSPKLAKHNDQYLTGNGAELVGKLVASEIFPWKIQSALVVRRHLPAFNMQLTVVVVHDLSCPSTPHVCRKYMSPRGASELLTSNSTRLIGHLKSDETTIRVERCVSEGESVSLE